MGEPLTVLGVTSYEKGHDFLCECKRLGCRVLLLTESSLKDAPWPRESIDDIFHMPDLSKLDELFLGVSHVARSQRIDRVVALDDYDVEPAAALREHWRLPGMGTSTAKRFRDKLAMRVRARDRGVLVPDFVHVLNDEEIGRFAERVSPPWVLKPRAEASTIGIRRIASADDLWPSLDALGDRRSYFLLEQFVPGDVCHVDSIVSEGQVIFSEAHMYARPPLEVFHEGGIHITRTIRRESEDEQALQSLNRQLVEALGMVRGVTHAEFIKGQDGRFYFLEVGARVGGANTVDLIEAATGINLWHEWAKLEVAGEDRTYHLPAYRQDYAGIIISLARQERPDTSAYTDPEIVWRMDKRYHVGLIVASSDPQRVETLLDEYSHRFHDDFHASLPPWMERPPGTAESDQH
jgi:hypothetical protein